MLSFKSLNSKGGQLLVVVHHTDNSPSLCYEPELIPDPIVCNHTSSISDGAQLDLGSVSVVTPPAYLQRLVYRKSSLIPDPLVSVPNFSRMVAILVRHRVPILDNGGTGLMDLGSVNAPPPLEHRQSGVGWSL